MSQVRCAIYTRKSSEEGLEQDFNSLDAQREACAAYIKSQRHEGWRLVNMSYDDGGISGGHLDRPALQRLMSDIAANRVDRIVVYKIDRLTRSLTDFARLVEQLERAGASFVSVTQSFNTATSMGRLTLNVLLSFAQFEREVTAERIRDKIAASKKKGLWMGGNVPLGYASVDRSLTVVPAEAETVRTLFDLYETLGSVTAVTREAERLKLRSKRRIGRHGTVRGNAIMSRGQVHHLLSNPIYAGRISNKGTVYEGLHDPIIAPARWDAIQARLIETASTRRGHRRKSPSRSPLAGKLVDSDGHRLTPTHAKKSERRYRYYVSQCLVAGTEHPPSGTWRLPAAPLETAIAQAVRDHLGKVVEQHPSIDAARIPSMKKRIDDLADDAIDLVSRARINDDTVSLELSGSLVADLLCNPPDPGTEHLRIDAPFEHRRRGVETRITIGVPTPDRDTTLIVNIARARSWLADLKAGATYADIATEAETTASYVRALLPLAFLSPTIVRSILDGQQPTHVTSRWLRARAIPAAWSEQARLVGIG